MSSNEIRLGTNHRDSEIEKLCKVFRPDLHGLFPQAQTAGLHRV